ncbi:MAG TPA: N-acetylmuramoyl-L-alanine amidase [Acidimicrobiia bacterium]|nr:N-acetylmuramoyl-L-alanine amidase [Acidimicrobiia bacterium]
MVTRRSIFTRSERIGAFSQSSSYARQDNTISIRPRDDWATDRNARIAYADEEVRFLLVHHSASSNDYTEEDVPSILRGFFDYHTSPEKGWGDVAYNFLIDRFGVIWEGRSGSVDRPVTADATGGNQGFSQLVCLIGDFSTEPPSDAATSSLVSTLAWLADRYGVSTAPGAEITFVSRGSNRWQVGEKVTTATIAGHRDMSVTSCPGDKLYLYVTGDLAVDVDAIREKSTGAASTLPATPDPMTNSTHQIGSSTTRPTELPAAVPATTTSLSQITAAQAETQRDSNDAWIRGLAGSAVAGLLAIIIKRRIDNARARSG